MKATGRAAGKTRGAAVPAAALIQPADLGFFVALAQAGSLSAAAREQGISTAAVSRHLAQMEARLGVTLLNRTTRRMPAMAGITSAAASTAMTG